VAVLASARLEDIAPAICLRQRSRQPSVCHALMSEALDVSSRDQSASKVGTGIGYQAADPSASLRGRVYTIDRHRRLVRWEPENFRLTRHWLNITAHYRAMASFVFARTEAPFDWIHCTAAAGPPPRPLLHS